MNKDVNKSKYENKDETNANNEVVIEMKEENTTSLSTQEIKNKSSVKMNYDSKVTFNYKELKMKKRNS